MRPPDDTTVFPPGGPDDSRIDLSSPTRVDNLVRHAGRTQPGNGSPPGPAGIPGYEVLGRLYAIGYTKGLMEAVDKLA